jgi:hypothetical protein
MALADEIARVRDTTLADLNAAHDYYTNTKAVWRIVQQHAELGNRVRVRNQHTRNVMTEKDLPDKARLYVAEYLTSATFQHFVSLFEDFVFSLLREWLLVYPHKLAEKQISVATSETTLRMSCQLSRW